MADRFHEGVPFAVVAEATTAAVAAAVPANATAFTLTSTAFTQGGIIPKVHECTSGGQTDPGRRNESPPLTWSGGPAGTRGYALVMRDLDNNNLIHWVIYDIPADVTSLPQNVEHAYRPTAPAGPGRSTTAAAPACTATRGRAPPGRSTPTSSPCTPSTGPP
ncbi:YbhB/YbcL family Raf kinase inhibitor-like protein [Nonomuraea sp. NPDC048881]|uniref:YbhB/YbcL family Raf kinase inhibitor-like protein n=1 Tax=Nonomuraea sp. NPDC048881 TaxID=3155030 RepID=UPI0033EC9288